MLVIYWIKGIVRLVGYLIDIIFIVFLKNNYVIMCFLFLLCYNCFIF